MNCEALQQLFVQYQLRELNAREYALVQKHLEEGCEACNAEMCHVATAIEALFEIGPEVPVTSAQFTSIMQRVHEQQTTACTLVRPATEGFSLQVKTGAVVACLISLVAGFSCMMLCVPTPAKTASETAVQRYQSLEASSRSLAEHVPLPSSYRIGQAEFRKTRFVALRPVRRENDFRGTAIWDPLGNELHFYGLGFPAPPVGYEYVLWHEGDDAAVKSLGTLVIDASGNCTLTAVVRSVVNPRIFVTLEPNGTKVTQPTLTPTDS